MSLSQVYVDQKVANTAEVLAFESRHKVPIKTVDDVQDVFNLIASDSDPVGRGKNVLLLTRNKGAFIKDCPGTRAYTCCGYKILHLGTFCVMDCSYCILQAYFHPPLLQYFVNHDDLIRELNHLFDQKRINRIGTGEFTDSLMWERWFSLSEFLIPQFADQLYAVLELKTKTASIENLSKLHHNRKTITAWSLNTPRVIRTEERGTASLSQRLRAAAECESLGYPLAFHFDPILIYKNCAAEYLQVIDDLFARISPENIVWISLGTFRFMPSLKTIIQNRFDLSKIIYGEFIRGLDGKMRYFKPLRINIYRQMILRIKELAPGVLVYLCMEDSEVWQKTLGFVPSEFGGLAHMLDLRAAELCDLRMNEK